MWGTIEKAVIMETMKRRTVWELWLSLFSKLIMMLKSQRYSEVWGSKVNNAKTTWICCCPQMRNDAKTVSEKFLLFLHIKGFSYLMSRISEAEHCHYAYWLEIVYFRFLVHQRPYVLLHSKYLVLFINNDLNELQQRWVDAPAGPLQIDLIKDMGAHLFLWYSIMKPKGSTNEREEKRGEDRLHIIKGRLQGNWWMSF